jgi:hypothetical protein
MATTGANESTTPTPQSSTPSNGGAKEQAQQAAGTAADESKRVAGVAQDEARRVASEATSQVQDLMGQATSALDEQSRTQRDRLVDTLRGFGDDLEKMASQGEGGLAADVARQVAERAHAVSSRLDGREPRDLLDDVRGFARRRPGTFLLGALAAGVVAGRLTRGAKASHDGSGTRGVSGGRTGLTNLPAGRPAGDLSAGPSVPPGPVTRPRPADVTSPADPLTTGAGAPSSAPVLGSAGDDLGTAAGDPLAGTGRPGTDPVYPSGTDTGGRA